MSAFRFPAASEAQNAFDRAFDAVILGNEFFEGAAYYRIYRDRYWNTFEHIRSVAPPPGASVLDIGSGQFALLCRELLGLDPHVADITDAYRSDLEALEVTFQQADLARGPIEAGRRYDLIVLAEVLEHLPRPPPTVLAELAALLEPGGHLVLTTPNLFRLRNVIRMVRGQPMLDPFNEPRPEAPLGHFVEYSLPHVVDYVQRAGLSIVHADLEQLSTGGTTRAARWARRLSRGLTTLVPRLRDNLVVVARRAP